jgi:hypothetical protein
MRKLLVALAMDGDPDGVCEWRIFSGRHAEQAADDQVHEWECEGLRYTQIRELVA